ncbi:aldehyde dehydrogenase family protein [Paenibacillus protaetiae]|uniref:Aldehyde dehydrogenase family protein n=1 Tax=Paenibacillus protaetiae TaxID=2509456 RepID=A0A4V0YFG5_9BACL|nr:aldehyde dehydrogenase family protein [Paenibacillus protaetiae]QAY67631.1 aldehyde dehydrogenase family protein [Paenibacillus protaetiae]
MKSYDLWIGGEWRRAARYEPLYAPYGGDKLADIAAASAAEAEEAIVNAHEAFLSYRNMPAYKRAEILYQAAALLEERSEACIRILVQEAGKPVKAARGEIARTAETYRFAAEEAKRIAGDQIPMDAAAGGTGRIGFTVKTPIGVITAITPFNFPFNLVAHKVGPALAAGNAIVLKPAEQTPLSALFLADLFRDAGLPDGVLNIIPGGGAELSEILTTHPHVKGVTFTGSPEVGRIIQRQAGLRKVTLELGSNSALIVDEGIDVASIIDRCVEGAFVYNGQVCISLQRVYVHRSLYEEFVARFVRRTEQLQIGAPGEESTDVTSLISNKALQRIAEWVDEAVQGGAMLECGGMVLEHQILAPTVLTGVNPSAKVVAEEVFGPVVSIAPFDTLEEAVAAVNRSRYGLHAGIYTPRIDRAFYAAREIDAGGVIINDIPTFRTDQIPYGGRKDSGIGREGIRYAVEEQMDTKFISFKLQP